MFGRRIDMLLCVCILVSFSPFTKRVMLHCEKYKYNKDYLSLFVLVGGDVSFLNRNDDHLVR